MVEGGWSKLPNNHIKKSICKTCKIWVELNLQDNNTSVDRNDVYQMKLETWQAHLVAEGPTQILTVKYGGDSMVVFGHFTSVRTEMVRVDEELDGVKYVARCLGGDSPLSRSRI